MSLETEFSRIATALETIATALTRNVSVPNAAPVAQPVVAAPVVEIPNVQPVPTQPAAVQPVTVTTVTASPSEAPAPVVAAPAAPTFTPPAAPVGVPFSDSKGLLAYVMEAYKSMGPIKGAQIQNVLTSLGVQNINDVRVEHYAQFHAGVEALRVA